MRRSCAALSWASETHAVGDVVCRCRYDEACPTSTTDATYVSGAPALLIRCAARIFAVVMTVGRPPVRLYSPALQLPQISIRRDKERPRRSNRHTTNASPGCNTSNTNSNSGRSVRAPLATSAHALQHPAILRPSSYNATSCSAVETPEKPKNVSTSQNWLAAAPAELRADLDLALGPPHGHGRRNSARSAGRRWPRRRALPALRAARPSTGTGPRLGSPLRHLTHEPFERLKRYAPARWSTNRPHASPILSPTVVPVAHRASGFGTTNGGSEGGHTLL